MVKPSRPAPSLVLAAILAAAGCSKRPAPAAGGAPEASATGAAASAPRNTIAPLIYPLGLPKVETVVTPDVHWAKETGATVDLDETFLFEVGMGDGRDGLNVTAVPASGHASHVYRTQDPKGGYRWVRVAFDVDHAEIERLVKALNDNGFLHLAERYEAKDLDDGARWIVHVRSGGLEKYVVADNTFPDPLVAVVRHVTTQIVDTRPALYGQSKPTPLGADYGDHLWRAARRYAVHDPEPGPPGFQDAPRVIGLLSPADPLPAGTRLELAIVDKTDGEELTTSPSTEPRFSVFYNEARIVAQHRYVLTATLLSGSQVVAVSEPLPVITLDGAHALEVPLRTGGAASASP